MSVHVDRASNMALERTAGSPSLAAAGSLPALGGLDGDKSDRSVPGCSTTSSAILWQGPAALSSLNHRALASKIGANTQMIFAAHVPVSPRCHALKMGRAV